MSYSFDVRADNKAAVMGAAEVKFQEMMATQPVHEADRKAAFANLQAHLDLCREATMEEEVIVHMHGSISTWADAIIGCGSGCNVYVQRRTVRA